MEYSAAQLSYLQHLDIDVWVSRAALESLSAEATDNTPLTNLNVLAGAISGHSAAAASVSKIQSAVHSVAVEALQKTVAPVTQSTVEKPTPVNPLSAPAFPKAENNIGHIEQPGAVSFDAGNVPGVMAVPHYTLQFWCYSSGLWLVSAENQLSPYHHMLAHNIAHFVHGKKRKPRHVGIFSWPMLVAPNIDQSAEVAQKYLSQHVQQLSGLVECKKLLVFSDVHDLLQQHNAVQMPATLTSLLTDPSVKKALWQFLISQQIES